MLLPLLSSITVDEPVIIVLTSGSLLLAIILRTYTPPNEQINKNNTKNDSIMRLKNFFVFKIIT